VQKDVSQLEIYFSLVIWTEKKISFYGDTLHTKLTQNTAMSNNVHKVCDYFDRVVISLI